ncbi:two-partner secretion domain-containing protein [Nodularia sp. NIES-3585]|uniref:two-partner secretion domain-containing protein n=1 Tax=Nodularia sp. NIES-3585 TaxID=1973477 RepID=UPI000B5CD325|nr:filamentous hemagglutinin N-terminal domain-containing protein [Nodularia sp. NIES-3585]GAX38943.1 filamentous hemagglutinin outer membrane protein [Nodularia sp. NIES-3585]
MKNKYAFLKLTLLSSISFFSIIYSSQAQTTADMTLPNNTNIKSEGNIKIIEGGTRSGGNLFHSMQHFSVPTGMTTYFNNPLDIQNIFARVTGGSISNIDGLIKSNGTANLFLLNPNGIIFGQNARLDIGGSFFATTADAIEFADDSIFSATEPQAPLLTIDIPIGLRFEANPGDIQVLGTGEGLTSPSVGASPITRNSNTTGLSLKPGNTLVLVGGNVNLQGSSLTVEGGRIEIGSVGSGLVLFNPLFEEWTLTYEAASSFRDIQLSERALVDTSGDSGGSIVMQGNNIYLTDGSSVLIQNQHLPSGSISIKASESLQLSGGSPNDGRFITLLRTESLGTENGANVNISTKNLILEEGANLGTRNYSVANGGNVNIDASKFLKLSGFSSFNRFFTSSIVTSTLNSGNAGDIKILTGSILAQDGGLISSLTRADGNGGLVIIDAVHSINLSNSTELISLGQEFINYIPSYIASQTFNAGNAGSLIINTSNLIVGNKATVNTSSTGSGSAGSLAIKATDLEVSGIISSAVVIADNNTQQGLGSPINATGNEGELTIDADRLRITGGLISARNLGTENGGTIRINADSISLEQQGSIAASTSSGEGGNLLLESHNLQLRNSTITATAASNGSGGNIIINTDTFVALERSEITANAFKGIGGNIQINTQGFFLSPDSKVTASSERGVDGTVQINAPQIDFTKATIVPPAVDIPSVINVCAAQSQGESGELVILSKTIPQTSNNFLSSLSGWEDNQDATATTEQAEDLTVDKTEQKFVEAQGWKTNDDGTISFTTMANDVVPYSSLNEPSCVNSQQFQQNEEEIDLDNKNTLQ